MAVRAPALDLYDAEVEEHAYQRAAAARPTGSAGGRSAGNGAPARRPRSAATARRVRAVDDAFRGADDAFRAPKDVFPAWAAVRVDAIPAAPDTVHAASDAIPAAPDAVPSAGDAILFAYDMPSVEDSFWSSRDAGSTVPEEQSRPVVGGVPGRRTITIRGEGAERYYGQAMREGRRRPPQRVHDRVRVKPDRIAMWAVLLGLLLVLVAALSSHAA